MRNIEEFLSLNVKFISFSLLICLLLMNMQCNDDDIIVEANCSEVLIDNNAYLTAETTNYSFENISISDGCMNVEVVASGCDPVNWIMTLIDSENIAESMPPQRYLKISIFNNETCLAVFNKEENFELLPLRVEGTNEVLLNIERFDEPILYSY